MQSLRVKLITPFIVGTLILTVLLSWYTYSSARQAVEDAMLLISETKTSQASGSMTLLFKSMSTNLQNLVVDPHVTALFSSDNQDLARKKTADWLNIITQGNEYYRDILIVDRDGVCISSSNPSHIGRSYMSEAYVRQALHGVFGMGEPSVGRVTKRFSGVSAGPVDGPDGVVGALILMNDFPKIVDYDSSSTHDDQTIFTALLSPDGQFMAHKDKKLMGNEERLFSQLYEQLEAVGEKGATVSYTLDGTQYVGYARVEPISKWVVITSGIESEVFASAYKVGATVLAISLVFLCAISFVVIRFANGILSSLLSLINYAKRVSEGDFDLPLEDTSRKDELGVLHKALHRLVHALQSMLLETQEASKMKGQFLANMSHEIRTPINAIIGMTHLSLRDRSLPKEQRKYIDNIQLAAKSLLGLINDILDLSKVEAGMLELEDISFNLRETTANILSIHQESASLKGLELSMVYDPGTPECFIGDPLRIGQVLNNLLSNAIKFTDKGSVSVLCKVCPDTEGLAELNYSQLQVSVTDTGIGIADDIIPTLFQSFTQADASITRQFGGTGLGLAISDKIVSLLGGGFTVTSKPKSGTTFSFSMILALDDASSNDIQEELPLDQAFAQLDLKSKKILIAEDNAINQMIMQELIEPSGAKIVIAENGQQAVDIAREESFDIVFMDMQMPVMDGLEATRIIRTFAQTLPIIAVTANAMKEDKERGFASGMNDYITKPIEPKQLLDLLRSWLKTDRTTDKM